MRRMLKLIGRDLLSTRKDFLLLYVLAAPLLLALGVRLFMPAVGQTTVAVAVTESFPPATVAELETYFKVEILPDRAALERRVLAYDDITGIVAEPGGGFTLVLEGNETHDQQVLPEMVLQHIAGGVQPTAMAQVDVGSDGVPLREWFGVFTGVGILFLCSTVMGLLIVEDKESRVMHALGVTPLGRWEYLGARTLLVPALAVTLTFLSVWIMGITAFDHLQALAAVLSGTLVAALSGFLIGAISPNQIAGVANVKFGSMLFLLPGILSLLIPQSFHPTLWWLPTYWLFTAFRTIFLDGGGWGAVAPHLAWTLLTSSLFTAVAFPWLKGKLELAHQ